MCEMLDKEKLNQIEKKKNFFQKLTSKKEMPFTAESCFIQSKYGEGEYRSPEERIKNKQDYIKNVIESKFAPSQNTNLPNYSSYHAVVDIEEDLRKYVDEIFKPFIDGGFEIINLSEKCKEVKDEGIYFINWKNAF